MKLWTFSHLLVSLLFLSLSVIAFAAGDPYSSRPDVLKLEGNPRIGDRREYWGLSDHAIDSEKRGLSESIAEILELYPQHHIYVMGRDGEPIFDVAKAATAGTPDESRLHLILTSRTVLKDPHLKNYLGQEGITEESLNDKTKSFLFVDTGYTGGASEEIEKLFPKYKSKFQSHFLISINPKHPSTRVFTTSWDKDNEHKDPQKLKWDFLTTLEGLPKYFDSGDRVELKDGRWEVFPKEGERHKQQTDAIDVMKDLKIYIRDPKNLHHFLERRRMWRELFNLWKGDQPKKLEEKLKNIIEEEPLLGKSIVKDFIETVKLNYKAEATKSALSSDPAHGDPCKIGNNRNEPLETLFNNIGKIILHSQ